MKRSKHELQEIAEMRKAGYRMLKGKERERAIQRMVDDGFMTRHKYSLKGKAGREKAKQCRGHYFNVFDKIQPK